MSGNFQDKWCGGLPFWIIINLGIFIKCASLQYEEPPSEYFYVINKFEWLFSISYLLLLNYTLKELRTFKQFT